MPPYLLSPEAFAGFLAEISAGAFPRASWNHAAHLAAAADLVAGGAGPAAVRERILAYNATQGIVSTEDYGYHETVTQFWVLRLQELHQALGPAVDGYTLARAAVAGFAHRGGIISAYYSYDVLKDRPARAFYRAPDLVISSGA